MGHRKSLATVALRYQALYLDVNKDDVNLQSPIPPYVLAFVSRLKDIGFTVDELLLHALAMVDEECLVEITDTIEQLLGVKLNWMPLVKGWDTPTGETRADHFLTFIANIFGDKLDIEGERLQCGHLIPNGTFPLERYNGCPFCGTPFRTAGYVFQGQGSNLKVLHLYTDVEMKEALDNLLASPTPLDATQNASLIALLECYDLPDNVTIAIKETEAVVVKYLIVNNRGHEAIKILKTPMDILRFLWYVKTNNMRLIEPRTLVEIERANNRHINPFLDNSKYAAEQKKQELKLSYNRTWCRRVALWLNATNMTAQQAAENMNPKRGMWVRMIRALRLGEYSRKKGFQHLADILDVFYKKNYTTWQGNVDNALQDKNYPLYLSLLKQKPGTFARNLFSAMLRIGQKDVLEAFDEITDKVPARLLLSMANAAPNYFSRKAERVARPISGGVYSLEAHPLVERYDDEQLMEMVDAIDNVFRTAMRKRFAAQDNGHKTIFVDNELYAIPLEVGDRTQTIHTFSSTPAGTRFKIEGDSVRLFLQWGEGLPAQLLDMDLSCRVIHEDGQIEDCAYYNLTCAGAKHSGDIRNIPEMVGTAEYIELSLPELQENKVKYVAFTCNAYSNGSLTPNLKVGWMNSEYPMKVSEEDGVAYDPSCVQQMVTVGDGNLSKGLVFGVLIVEEREIVWMEMPYAGQYAAKLNVDEMKALLHIVENKITIGQLLDIKASAQKLLKTDNKDEADEVYTKEWAVDTAKVNQLLKSLTPNPSPGG